MHLSSPTELSALESACLHCDRCQAATDRPQPLTPPDCDLRSSGMLFMPLDVGRLMDSDLFAIANGEEFKAAMALYAKSWMQVPAASLPNDDRVLAHLAGGFTPRRWQKIKAVALRGWILCTDGRLYHPVIAELAHDAWEKSRHFISDVTPTRRASSQAERARRYRERQRLAKMARSEAADHAVTAPVTRDAVTPTVTETVTASVTQNVTPVTLSFKREMKKEGGNVTTVTPTVTGSVTRDAVTVSQRQLPVLTTMPAAPGADAPSPPPDLSGQYQAKTGKLRLTPDEQRLCDATWAKYGAAFQERYDVPPLKDGKASYHIASLVRSLGIQAPEVAAHYVRSNHDWYVKKGHDIATLLGDLQKLRAEWMATQKRAEQVAVTQRQAQFTPNAPPARATADVQAALQELTRRFIGPRTAAV